MKIKKSKLIEHFRKYRLSESFIKKFITFIKKQGKERELEKVMKDPEYQKILKKYNIKPVDWESTKDDPWFDR
jgi:hypothetical protein